ncbi:MAG: tetratricopeptide repeat-containing sensor histidine kinase [Candidatus Zophobacter franzmannii]|nr:tetratricopeptide repeat-containing sensor histidine kinase [Candidatus Zophobacter franzmannii]
MGKARSFENEVVQKHYNNAIDKLKARENGSKQDILDAVDVASVSQKWYVIHDYLDELITLAMYDEAKEFIHMSVGWYDKEGAQSGHVALLYRNLAVVEYRQANFEEAFTHLYIAKDKCPPTEKYIALLIKNDFGIIYYHLNDLKQAEECFLACYEEGKKILSKDDEDYHRKAVFVNNILINLGSIYNRTCNYFKAKELYSEGLEVFKSLNEFSGIANIYNNLGIIEASLGDYQKSKEHFEKSINLKEDGYDIRGLARSYVNLGECNLLLENYDEAIEKTQTGLTFAKNSTYNELITTALDILARSYEGSKDYEKAFHFLQELKIASDDYKSRLHKQKLAELQVQYKTKEHEKDKEIYRLQNIDLAQALTVRDKLFSVIAHDLKGPVNNVYATLEMFQDSPVLSVDELKGIISDLYFDTKATVFLLDNLLQWGQSHLNKDEIQPKAVNLLPIIDSVVNLNRNNIDHKGIILNNKIHSDLEVFCDKNVPSLVLRNILTNATKFTPSGGVITLKAKVNDDFTLVTIADSGIGIKPQNIKNLFVLDMNKSTFGTNAEKGAGLGLYLSYDYIKQAGGDITVRSVVGEGTEFTVHFPNNSDSFLKATEESN